MTGGLVDTRWKIDTVRGAPMVSFVRTSFLQLRPHQTIFGADTFVAVASCNALQGACAINGDQIRFTGISSTAMGCPQGVEVMKALGDACTWRRSGNKLHLYDAVTLELTWCKTLGSDSNPAAPRPTGTGIPGPAVDGSKSP
ncbi:MAG: META domain-containing protein [Propionibacteriaceae bacterium]